MKNKEIIIGGISANEQILLVKQMHAGIRAGYSVMDALKLAQAQAKGRLKQTLEDVVGLVEGGAYLHEAFGKYPKYFSPLFINLIKTGELSGSLEESLQRLYEVLNKERDFRQKVRSAMTYPTFVLVAVVGLGLAVAIFILPNLLPLFKSLEIELPLSTRILIWFAELFEKRGLEIFVGFVVFVTFSVWAMKQKFARPFSHWVAIKLPLLGHLMRQITMARFSRTLESLLRSGVPIDQSLEISATIVTNYYYQNSILAALPTIAKGETLADALERYPKLYDDLFVKMLALGESTGGLEGSFSYIAEYFENEVDQRMKNLAVSLEPMLLIVVGLLVAFVALSILGPIYSITGNLR